MGQIRIRIREDTHNVDPASLENVGSYSLLQTLIEKTELNAGGNRGVIPYAPNKNRRLASLDS